MSSESAKAGDYYGAAPYDQAFDIGYPQENLEGEMYKYRCKYCKRLQAWVDFDSHTSHHW